MEYLAPQVHLVSRAKLAPLADRDPLVIPESLEMMDLMVDLETLG